MTKDLLEDEEIWGGEIIEWELNFITSTFELPGY